MDRRGRRKAQKMRARFVWPQGLIRPWRVKFDDALSVYEDALYDAELLLGAAHTFDEMESALARVADAQLAYDRFGS